MDLVQMIHEAIRQDEPQQHRSYIGASIVGRPCYRSIWYEFKGESNISLEPTVRAIFDVGKSLELLILDYVEMTGLKVERAVLENDYLFFSDKDIPVFQGHADAIIHLNETNKVVLEVKTANAASFGKFKTRGLKDWHQIYYAQIMSYMGMSGIHHAVLLAMNKDTSELHQEWLSFDETYYEELKEKARLISLSDTPPPKINSSPLYFMCNRCHFVNVCHHKKEVNHV